MEIDLEKILNFICQSSATLEEIEAAKKYLMQLEKDSIKLSYLEAYGVDNWLGYDIAMGEYYNNNEEE